MCHNCWILFASMAPTSAIDDLWWRTRFHDWKLRYHAHVASLFLHSWHELLCYVLNMSSPSYSPPFFFAIHHSTLQFCKISQFIVEDAHNGKGSFGGSLLELCNANMASRLWSLGSCWTLLIKIVNCAIVHFHSWFIIHELFFHDWLQKCKFLSSSSLLITMVFLIMLWFWCSCAGTVVVIMMQL